MSMCRHKHEGRERCPSDTSEARRLRRKNQKALESHSPVPSIEPDIPSAAELLEFSSLRTIEDMKLESAKISELLKAPQDPDADAQREIDAIIERRVTHLGNALAEEAEKRARFSQSQFERSYNRPSWETLSNQIIYEDHTIETKRQIKMREEACARLAEGYRSVIADIRPVGGELNLDHTSDPGAVEVIQNSVGKYFPSAWIQSSAEGRPLIVSTIDADQRAQYSGYERFPDREDGERNLTEKSFAIEAESLGELSAILSDGTDKFEHTGEPEVLEDGTLSYTITVPKRYPFNPEVDSADIMGTPNGDGWKHGYILNDDGSFSEEKHWYRHEYEKGSTLATLSLYNASDDPTNFAAYHEFTHRSEEVVRNGTMGRMQESFLKRRTTSASGERESLIQAYPSGDGEESELVRRDNFMISYIGKEYDGTVHREVMAVASEALFSGKYGAFLGLNKDYKEDKDHRAFALGIFATV